MARGPKKHLKKIGTPKSWMLGKLDGIWAKRPSTGPHKLRECLPLFVLLRQRLQYALNGREVTNILKDRECAVRIDKKLRKDPGFPCGIMDIVDIEKSGEKYRILYDVKGRFVLKSLKGDEGKIKLLKVVKKAIGPNKIPYITTHDARTIRFPNPEIEVNDTLKFDLEQNKILDFCKLDLGNVVYITAGNNIGRVGMISHIEKHPGSFDIVHIRDSQGKSFATRKGNVFVLGKGKKPWISLPSDNGLYLTALEERKRKMSM